MTLVERTQIGSHVAVIALCGVVAVCAVVLTRSMTHTIAGVDSTLVNINHKCQGPAGPDACGTLAQVNKVGIAFGNLGNQSADQVKQLNAIVTATVSTIDGIGTKVDGLTDHLSRTSDAVTNAATNASGNVQTITEHVAPLLDTTKTTVADLGDVATGILPVEKSANKAVVDLDAEVQSKDLQRIIANFADMTDTGTHMMKTTDAVETKLTQCTLHPTISCTLKSDVLFGAQVGGYILGAIH